MNEGLSVPSFENTVSLGMTAEKAKIYESCEEKVSLLCEGEDDVLAKMASVVGVLHNAMADFYWTGFYRVVGDQLVIGPYQGTVGCLRIPFGRGVCGTAAQERKTQVVVDVHEFPGHIACDENSRSEIVLPVFNGSDELIAVLDIDSTSRGAFCEVDKLALERLLAGVFPR